MDDRQFDRLTRALAGGAPRRSVLRALGGGVGAALVAAARRGAPAAAHHGRLGPGDACYDSSQCLGADAPLVCADNGFADDGPLNCCAYEGSRCGFDEACCGAASCVGGFCSSAAADGIDSDVCLQPGVQGCPCSTGTRFPCPDPAMVCVADNPGLPGGPGSCWYP